jgi:hypothetical protein
MPRFQSTAYNSVIDTMLGNEWFRDADADRTYAQADSFAKNCTAGQHSWNMPTQAQLQTLADADISGTNLAAFSGNYSWSCTAGQPTGTAVGIDVGGEGDPLTQQKTVPTNMRALAHRIWN